MRHAGRSGGKRCYRENSGAHHLRDSDPSGILGVPLEAQQSGAFVTEEALECLGEIRESCACSACVAAAGMVDHVFWDCPAARASMLSPALRAARVAGPVATFRCGLIPNMETESATALHAHLSHAARQAPPLGPDGQHRPAPRALPPPGATLQRCLPLSWALLRGGQAAEVSAPGGSEQLRVGEIRLRVACLRNIGFVQVRARRLHAATMWAWILHFRGIVRRGAARRVAMSWSWHGPGNWREFENKRKTGFGACGQTGETQAKSRSRATSLHGGLPEVGPKKSKKGSVGICGPKSACVFQRTSS